MLKRFTCALFACLILAAGTFAQTTKKPDRVEKNVNRALAFLSKSQDADGAWRLSGRKSPAATALAVMAFLSAGHVPGEGKYQKTIEKGLQFVIKSQLADGTFSVSYNRMYEQGICTLMLAEAAGMTKAKTSSATRKCLQKAIEVILKAQRSYGSGSGGWRYNVNGIDADVSVTGWQLLALKAAKNIGCNIPAKRIKSAVKYILRCQDKQNGAFRYRPAAFVTRPCTGTGILCLELCHKHHSKEAKRAGYYLIKDKGSPSWNDEHFFYSVYYCSQATFQLGGNYWAVYRPRLHKVLFDNQGADGSWYDPSSHGKAYGTSMAVLALTVEYRLLPIYQRSEDKKRK